MIDISMDITTSITILSGLATVLGFFWTIIHNKRKKDEAAEEDPCSETTQEHEEELKKLKTQFEDLQQMVRDHSTELEKLSELSAISKDENARLRQDFLDNLDRIENRLEKMIDLILRIKRDDN